MRTTSGPASASAELTRRGARRGRPNDERRAAAGRAGRARATAESSAPGQSLAGTPVPTRGFRRRPSALARAPARARQYARRHGDTTPRPLDAVDTAAEAPTTDDARRGGAARRGDLDRRDVRRLLTPPPRPMLDRRLALDPQVALRPEPFGALAYHYGNRRLIFLKHPDVVRVVRALGDHDTVADALRACDIAESRWPSFVDRPRVAGAFAPDPRGRPGMTPDPTGRAAQGRARRPDLPDVGADVRLQPGVRALPVVVGPARPARAVDGRGQGRARRAAAAAGLLHQHRRRRADDPQGLLRARRRTPSTTASASSSRPTARTSTPPPPAGWRRWTTWTSRSASTASTRGDQRPRARRRLLRHGAAGDGPPRRRRVRAVQDLGRRDPPQRRPARRLQGAGRLLRRPAARHPPAPVGPRRRLVARAAPDERPAVPDLHAGCWPTARTSSPATRSSTSTRSASRCPG